MIIILVALLGLVACTTNSTKQDTVKVEKAAVNTKVAIMPLKSLDSASRYINKIMMVRDLELTFDKYPNYVLQDLTQTAQSFKETGYDVEELEIEELREISSDFVSDVIVTGTISENRNGTFNVAMRLFSPRSDDLKQVSFNVGKERTGRWKALDDNLMKELDAFVSNEMDKLFSIATNNYNNANYIEAEKTLKQIVALKPDKVDAYYYLGLSYVKMDNYPAAEASFIQAKKLNPEDQRYSFALIDIYEKTNELPKRIVLMEEIATTNNDEEAWLAVGNLYDQMGNKASAKAAFRKALVVNPEYPTANVRLALMLFDEGNYNDAIPYLEKAFDQAPDNEVISRKLATSYQRSGRMEDAVAKYEGLIKNDPGNVNAYLNVIGLYRNMASETTDTKISADLNKKALDTIAALKKIDPNNEYVYLNLAAIYLAQNKYTDAETNANLTIAKNSTLYQPYLILAVVYQSRGTESYNSYIDLDRQAAKAVGKQATKLKNDRDAAKANANTLFRRAETNLRTALSLATEDETKTDINNRLANVSRLIGQTL